MSTAETTLRVAWLIYGALDQVSGGYIYDQLVVEQLREFGDTVTVISLTPGAAELPQLAAKDFDVLVGDELCFRDLGRVFQCARPTLRCVLLIHHLTAWEHPEGSLRSELLALEKTVIELADACIATSQVTADRLQAEGLGHCRARVAEPGADRMPRPENGSQEPSGFPVRLLFVGNILRRKRVLELCAAFASVTMTSAELVLVGAELEADYAAEVRDFVRRVAVGDRIRFLGALPATGVAEQFSQADAVVLPSALEGYGMVLSEALWLSVPIVAARVGAAEQLVGKSGAGLLFDPDDPSALRHTLGTFINDGALRAKLRRAASHAANLLPRWRDTALALRATLVK